MIKAKVKEIIGTTDHIDLHYVVKNAEYTFGKIDTGALLLHRYIAKEFT